MMQGHATATVRPWSARGHRLFAIGGLCGIALIVLGGAWWSSEQHAFGLATLGFFAVLGAWVARRPARSLHAHIERQLERIAAQPPTAEVSLSPLFGRSPAVQGWNILRERLRHSTTLAHIEQQLAQQAGGASGHPVDAALDSLSAGVAVTDESGRLRYQNNALRAMLASFSNAPDESHASNDAESSVDHRPTLQELLESAGVTLDESRLEKLRRSAPRVTFEVTQNCGDTEAILQFRGTEVLAGGRPTGETVWLVQDITQQRMTDHLRDEFVSTATHELRTPLANIKAYAETLSLDGEIDVERQKDFCNIINSEATRLSRFVDELLSVSRLQCGSLALNRAPTNVQRLIEDVVEHVRPEMEARRQSLTMDLPPKLPELILDKDKFSAALVNLLGNASKYTPETGAVRVRVDVTGDLLSIHVEDSGIGIAPEELPRIFEKFYRSQDERVQQLTGSGLGLTFTQEVVRLHGGMLRVHSELNKGSRFTVELPLTRVSSTRSL